MVNCVNLCLKIEKIKIKVWKNMALPYFILLLVYFDSPSKAMDILGYNMIIC